MALPESIAAPLRRRFESPKLFTAALCIVILFQSALAAGYYYSVITTMELVFHIRSLSTGVIASSFELGNLATILFVSYFGHRRGHVPRWIGVGAFVIALGAALFSLPHFLVEHHHHHQPVVAEETPPPVSYKHRYCSDSDASDPDPVCSSTKGESEEAKLSDPAQWIDWRSNTFAVVVFIVAQVLVGAGSSPLYTLGTTFIDDHVEAKASIFLGILYSMGAVGPVCGFLLGAWTLTYHKSLSAGYLDRRFDVDSSEWQGAWWVGFLLLAACLILAGGFLFLFPRRLRKLQRRLSSSSPATSSAVIVAPVEPEPIRRPSNVSGAAGIEHAMPTAVRRILTNRVFIFTSLTECAEAAITTGFLVFLPKVLELQFGISKPLANVLVGTVALAAATGALCGGLLVERLGAHPRKLVRVLVAASVVVGVCFITTYFFRCFNEETMYGYPFGGDEGLRGAREATIEARCHCTRQPLEPLCYYRDDDYFTYLNPCWAGCRSPSTLPLAASSTSSDSNVSLQCAFTPPTDDTPHSYRPAQFERGICRRDCAIALALFVVAVYVIAFLLALSKVCSLLLTLRSVEQQSRSLALALQLVFLRVFAYIPAPILFGLAIDRSCALWNSPCSSEQSDCVVYSPSRLHHIWFALAATLKILSFSLLIANLYAVDAAARRERSRSTPSSTTTLTSSSSSEMHEIGAQTGSTDDAAATL